MRVINIIRKLKRKLIGPFIKPISIRGFNIDSEIRKSLRCFDPGIIFDVGANLGQSAYRFSKAYRSATIYCFEPNPHAFKKLQENTRNNRKIKLFENAMGSTSGNGVMIMEQPSDNSFLLRGNNLSQSSPGGYAQDVAVSTIDDFCRENNIGHIQYLKIDTEGGDLNVLKGAKNLLNLQNIDLIETEVGMNPENKKHVPLEEIKKYMEDHFYYLFGIYEQVNEFPTDQPHLRRSNPVFISKKMIESNSKPR